MDADFSHDPRTCRRCIDTAIGGADLVLGSRYVEGRRHGELGREPAAHLARAARSTRAPSSGVKVRDLTGGFKCFNRRVLEAIDLDAVQSSGYAFQIELTYRALKKGFTVKEVPIVFEDRRVGQSKMSRKIFLEAVTMVWKLRFTV